MNSLNQTAEILDHFPDLLNEITTSLSLQEIAALITNLPQSQGLSILTKLAPWKTKQVFKKLKSTQINDLIENAALSDLVPLLKLMDENKRTILLNKLNPKQREKAQSLLIYPEEAVGAWMRLTPFSCKSSQTIKSVLEGFAFFEENDVHLCHILNEDNTYNKSISFSNLVKQTDSIEIGNVKTAVLTKLNPYQSMHKVLSLKDWFSQLALPVLDENHMLIGEISHINLREFRKNSKQVVLSPPDINITPLNETFTAMSGFFKGLDELTNNNNRRR